jgi:hypothetical protein
MTKTDLSYDEWIDYVFGHAVPFYGQVWYWEPDTDWWSPRPEQAIDYLTRLLENPEPLTEQFADSQIGLGLHYLVSESVGSYCRFLNDGTVPIEARIACIAAMRTLMRDTLRLPNPACQENALHGLGHWARAYPEFTGATIDAYLAANPKLRPELVRYAQSARSGCVQ